MTVPSSWRLILPVTNSTRAVQYSCPDSGGNSAARRSLSETRSARAGGSAGLGRKEGSGGISGASIAVAGRRRRERKCVVEVRELEARGGFPLAFPSNPPRLDTVSAEAARAFKDLLRLP